MEQAQDHSMATLDLDRSAVLDSSITFANVCSVDSTREVVVTTANSIESAAAESRVQPTVPTAIDIFPPLPNLAKTSPCNEVDGLVSPMVPDISQKDLVLRPARVSEQEAARIANVMISWARRPDSSTPVTYLGSKTDDWPMRLDLEHARLVLLRNADGPPLSVLAACIRNYCSKVGIPCLWLHGSNDDGSVHIQALNQLISKETVGLCFGRDFCTLDDILDPERRPAALAASIAKREHHVLTSNTVWDALSTWCLRTTILKYVKPDTRLRQGMPIKDEISRALSLVEEPKCRVVLVSAKVWLHCSVESILLIEKCRQLQVPVFLMQDDNFGSPNKYPLISFFSEDTINNNKKQAKWMTSLRRESNVMQHLRYYSRRGIRTEMSKHTVERLLSSYFSGPLCNTQIEEKTLTKPLKSPHLGIHFIIEEDTKIEETTLGGEDPDGVGFSLPKNPMRETCVSSNQTDPYLEEASIYDILRAYFAQTSQDVQQRTVEHIGLSTDQWPEILDENRIDVVLVARFEHTSNKCLLSDCILRYCQMIGIPCLYLRCELRARGTIICMIC